jgi:hypothetical protein
MSKMKLTLVGLAAALTVTFAGARAGYCYTAPVTEMGVKMCYPDSSTSTPYPMTYIKFAGYYWDISTYDIIITKPTKQFTYYSSPSAMFSTIANISMSTGKNVYGGCATCNVHTCPGDPTQYWVLEHMSIP